MSEGADQRAEEADTLTSDLPLQNIWTFWYDEKAAKGMEHGSYASALKQLGEFGTVQEFWRYMNHIDVNNLPAGSNLRLFKRGIEPTWEDPVNENGGKYVFEIPNGIVVKDAWTYTLLALVGETFQSPESICGAVLSVRPRTLSTINIWNTSSFHPDDISRGESDIHRLIVAKLAANRRGPVTLKLHYQPHQKSVDWNQLWTTTKSKEQVLAQLAVSSDTIAAKKTLTSSPNSSRRSKLSVDQASNSHGSRHSLRSSTGSMSLQTAPNEGTKASTMPAPGPTRNGSHPNLGTVHAINADSRKSTGSIQRTITKPLSSDSSPRLASSPSSSPSDPNPLQAGLSSKLGDPLVEHDSSAATQECDDQDEEMRSPFMLLSASKSTASAPSKPMPPHHTSLEIPTLLNPRPLLQRNSNDSWASMSSLTSDADSEPSPRSFSVATDTVDPTQNFAAVMQEVQNPQQWWLHSGYRRRGRPELPLQLPLDTQLRVPEVGDESHSFGGASLSNSQGFKTRPALGDTSSSSSIPSSSAPTSEKRKRKRPSRGGSRDKTRSKEVSPAHTPSHSPTPSFTPVNPPAAHSPTSSPASGLSKIRSSSDDLSPASASSSQSGGAVQDSSDSSFAQEETDSTPVIKNRSDSVVELVLDSDYDVVSRTEEKHLQDDPAPPSVVIVSPDQEGDSTSSQSLQGGVPAKHHRKRSRGRGAGSRSKSEPSRIPISTAPSEHFKTIGMICTIVLLMVMCYLLGRMSNNSSLSFTDAILTSFGYGAPVAHMPLTQAKAQPRLARQHL